MRTIITHSGLQDGIKRFDLLEALDCAKGMFGLKPIDLAYMRLAFAKTRETDFKSGHVCGFWDNVAALADQLGINTRHLNRIETRLEQVGLIAKTTLSNRGRWGGRGADGSIEGLAGINLGPIINRAEEIFLAAQTQRNTQTRLKELRRETCDLIKRVRTVTDEQATALLSQVDKRLRPSEIQSVERLQTIIEGLVTILHEFELNNSGQTKGTPRSDQNVRPYTHKQKTKNTCSVTIGQMKSLATADFRGTLEFYDCQSWGDISQPASDYAQQVGISRTQWQRRCQEIGEPRAVLCLLVADRNASRANEDRYKVRSIPKAFMGMARKEAMEEGVLISLISEIRTFFTERESCDA